MKTELPIKTYKRPKQSDCRYLPNSMRYYRLQAGMNMQEVADILGICIQSVWEMERKTRYIHRKYLYRLAEIWKVDPYRIDRPGIFFSER